MVLSLLLPGGFLVNPLAQIFPDFKKGALLWFYGNLISGAGMIAGASFIFSNLEASKAAYFNAVIALKSMYHAVKYCFH